MYTTICCIGPALHRYYCIQGINVTLHYSVTNITQVHWSIIYQIIQYNYDKGRLLMINISSCQSMLTFNDSKMLALVGPHKPASSATRTSVRGPYYYPTTISNNLLNTANPVCWLLLPDSQGLVIRQSAIFYRRYQYCSSRNSSRRIF